MNRLPNGEDHGVHEDHGDLGSRGGALLGRNQGSLDGDDGALLESLGEDDDANLRTLDEDDAILGTHGGIRSDQDAHRGDQTMDPWLQSSKSG